MGQRIIRCCEVRAKNFTSFCEKSNCFTMGPEYLAKTDFSFRAHESYMQWVFAFESNCMRETKIKISFERNLHEV